MPRDGSNIYTLPFPNVTTDTSIESPVYNGFTNDVANDLNAPRPIIAGGTGANNANDALAALGAEKAGQVVTNFDSHVWVAGSFYAATTATGEPVDGHAFSGIVYMADSNNIVVEARDSSDGKLYIRRKVAGVWSAWTLDNDLSGVNADIDAVEAALLLKVAKAGDTMSGPLALLLDPEDATHATRKSYVDGLGEALEDYVDAAGATIAGMTKKNYIINGAMMVSQENGGTAMTTNGSYAVDQFRVSFSTTGTLSHQQAPLMSLAGSPNRLRITCLTFDTTPISSEFVAIVQAIEGYRIADLKFGTSLAKTFTIQFGVRAPAGTYSIAVMNGASNRSYAAEYTISPGEANTDVVRSVTIPGDQAGTWLIDNGVGLYVQWCLMCANAAGFGIAPNVWTTGGAVGSSGQSNFMALGSNAFHLFDVSLTEGSVASPFVVPDYPSELAACQRYFIRFSSTGTMPLGVLQTYTTSLAGGAIISLPVEMRTLPAVTFSSSAHFTASTPGGGSSIASSMVFGSTPRSITISTSTFAATLAPAGGAAGFSINTASGWINGSARL